MNRVFTGKGGGLLIFFLKKDTMPLKGCFSGPTIILPVTIPLILILPVLFAAKQSVAKNMLHMIGIQKRSNITVDLMNLLVMNHL